MKIAICGSMNFSQEMKNARDKLKEMGHQVFVPEGFDLYIKDTIEKRKNWRPEVEGAQRKIDHDLIRNHYKKISNSDAILVINKDKKGIANYIGGNSFLEMGFAHVLDKKIFVLNPLPETQETIYQELVAMQPIVLRGDLAKIGRAA